MIKKFNQFVKENIELSNSSARIYIDSDEAEMFTTEPALQKLVSDRKVSLDNLPELWFESEDKNTIDILKGYFPDAEFNTEYMDEEEDDSDEFYDDDFGFDSPFCKGCKGTGCKECDGSGMKRNSIGDDEVSNEEINLKGLAAGAMMALMTACHNGEVNGESSEGYTGDMLVKKIEMGGSKRNYFLVHGLDKEGKYVEFKTDQLTFNVGDSIHVDFSEGEAYPLDDKENIGKF